MTSPAIDPDTLARVTARLDAFTPEMVELQRILTAIPALGPVNGGQGEWAKVERLAAWLREHGLDEQERIDAPDPDAEEGLRPNLVARLPGRRTDRTLWIMTHTDVVPPGDPAGWETDPWTLVERDGRLYGRGVEDNQQGLVASVFAARALVAEGLAPARTLGLLFCADEETGSRHGLGHVLKTRPDLVGPDDLVVVPDAGQPDGRMIEIAEKSVLWMRCTVRGRQCHASRPDDGLNAARIGADLLQRLDRELHERFNEADPLFLPPESTIEPTRRLANVPNVNTVPGEDVFYLDCRILPVYDPADVLAAAAAIGDAVAAETGATIRCEADVCQVAPPPTSAEAPVVRALAAAVRDVVGVEAEPRGIGGGTVAACFRRRNLPAAVWGSIDQMAHQPNEYCVLAQLVRDAKVFAHVALQDG
ncbi:MAG: M20 family metallo-hydrolase [Planctomycetota bacterium]